MTKIYLTATDQLLSVSSNPTLASGDVNSVTLHVDFSEEWDGLGRVAVFFTEANTEDIYEIPLVNNECLIPHEVLAESGTLYIGTRGTYAPDTQTKTSTLVKYTIKDGTPAGTGTTVPPTADVYQQLLTAYGDTQSMVEDVRKRFEETLKKTYKTYDLLWENPDPTEDFQETTVEIGADVLALYSNLLITYKGNKADTYDESSVTLENLAHEPNADFATGHVGGYAVYVGDRKITRVTQGVWFGNSYYKNDSGETVYRNGLNVPCKIYGVNQFVRTDIDAQVEAAVEKLFIPLDSTDEYEAIYGTEEYKEGAYYMICEEVEA